jgi:hypothetical protein
MAAFGQQIRQFLLDSGARKHLGGPPEGLEPPNKVRAVVQVILTAVIVAAALYVLLTGGFSDTAEKAVVGLLGTVIGYWFH